MKNKFKLTVNGLPASLEIFQFSGGEIQVKVDTYNNIIDKYLAGIAPDILFCDAEGLDETIIYSINYKIFSPKIICIETYAYGIGSKNENIIHFLRSKKFSLHADTFVNSIFIKL